MVPHFGHMEAVIAVVTAGVHIYALVRDTKEENAIPTHATSKWGSIYVGSTISLKLTLAGLQAFKPSVFHFSVPGSSTLPKPSTARSATTFSAGFLERAACLAHHLISNRRGHGCRGDRRVDY